MKRSILSLLCVLSLMTSFACTKDENKSPLEYIFCPVADAVIFQVSQRVATELGCRAPEMIMYDLKKVTVERMGICKSQKMTGLSFISAACNAIGKELINYAASSAIPESWQCDADAAKDKLSAVLSSACSQIKI